MIEEILDSIKQDLLYAHKETYMIKNNNEKEMYFINVAKVFEIIDKYYKKESEEEE